MRPPPIAVLESYNEQVALFTRAIRDLAAKRGKLEILEAGCGRTWPLKLDGVDYRLTGIDVDRHGLEARRTIAKDLDEAIVADLRSVDLPAGKFDVIYSSYVLEHIDGAERVLDNFGRWLKDGGVLLLVIPDRGTVWNFVSEMTPYKFHVLFKRVISKNPNAGKPGFGPFPTYHDPVVSRAGLREYCARSPLTIRHEFAKRFDPARLKSLVTFGTKAIGALSLGRLSSEYCDLVYVVEKSGGAAAQR